MSGGRHVEFCPKIAMGANRSGPLVDDRRRLGRKFATASIGSGRFLNLEKSRDTL